MSHATTNLEPQESTLLREINFGIRENLPSHMTAEEARDIIASKSGIDKELIVDVAETTAEVQARQCELFRTLETDLNRLPNESGRIFNVLCVTHGGFIKSLMNHHCNLELTSIRNCSINMIELVWNYNDGISGPPGINLIKLDVVDF